MSRSLGLPLTPKAVKYFDRRPYPPGPHRRPARMGPYKERLLEKQRLRFQYNISEKQLRSAFDRAARRSEPTGLALLEDLETRLDALVLRAGFARTIYQARQFVSHGHVAVDGRRIDRPAYRVRPGQSLGIGDRSRAKPPFRALIEVPEVAAPPSYLDVELASLRAVLTKRPARREIPVICNEQLVVEYYAR